MIIPINETLRIHSEPHCWVVQCRKGTKWESRTYHPTFEAAIRASLSREIREINDSLGVEAVLRRIDELIGDITFMSCRKWMEPPSKS